jgi:hypothetical protein
LENATDKYRFGFFVKQGEARAVSFTIPLIEKQNDKGVLVFIHRGSTQEKVDEISGAGNHNTALFWEYDTRLGRRWNVDPVDQMGMSNYACLGDNPIVMIDRIGDKVGTITSNDHRMTNEDAVEFWNSLVVYYNKIGLGVYINKILTSEEIINIEFRKFNPAFRTNLDALTGATDPKTTSTLVLSISQGIYNAHTDYYMNPAEVSFHEIIHAYLHLMDSCKNWEDKHTKDERWHNIAEKNACAFESLGALKIRYLPGTITRKRHGGVFKEFECFTGQSPKDKCWNYDLDYRTIKDIKKAPKSLTTKKGSLGASSSGAEHKKEEKKEPVKEICH